MFVVTDPNPGTALGVNVFPLLTATPCLAPHTRDDNSEGITGNVVVDSRNRIQLWQGQECPPEQQQHHHHHHHLVAARDACGDGGGTGTCQDCGNQAKKDCRHRRCRTCCKSRGFDCATHVKSTWVPAARRRERHLAAVATPALGSTSGAKKPRLVTSQTTTTSHTSTSNNTTTPPRSFDTGSSHQDVGLKESLPCQVRAPAVFKCVRVTAVNDGEDEYAFQAVVKIAGHVFKGFLYDQGVEDKEEYPNLSELHLGGGGNVVAGGNHRGCGCGNSNGVSSSSPMMNPSDVYGGGGLLRGSSNYGN